jgi:hypothetical protein
MRRANATGACVVLLIGLTGCADCFLPRPPPPAPPVRRHVAAPAASPKPEVSIVERAKADQDGRCGQRHVDRAEGTLKETTEEKHDRDDRCSELHRHDYVR